MDVEAARRARRKKLKDDLLEAFDDDEASPPEFVDLAIEIDGRIARLRERVPEAVEQFVADPDIRTALRGRERAEADIRREAHAINEKVKRLNFIAPHDRFQRAPLDADTLVRPLYKARRVMRATDP